MTFNNLHLGMHQNFSWGGKEGAAPPLVPPMLQQHYAIMFNVNIPTLSTPHQLIFITYLCLCCRLKYEFL